MEKIKIEWVCFLNNTGYSNAAINYIMCLEKSGLFDVKITCIHDSPKDWDFFGVYSQDIKNMLEKKRDPDSFQVFHCVPEMQNRVKRNKKTIGFATFETFDPPRKWSDILNTNNAVICPSIFNLKIFSTSVNKPMYHIPHCLNSSDWNITADKPKEEYKFLFINSWKRRKCWDKILEAYFLEFSNDDNISLTIKTDNKSISSDINFIKKNTLKNLNLPKYTIYKDDIKYDDLPNFMNNYECLVSSTLGEGFGLSPLQFCFLGKPCIATNFSGYQDYLNIDNSVLIDHDGFISYENMDNIPQFSNKVWPHLRIDKIRKALRFCYENKTDLYDRSQKNKKQFYDKFSYECISEKLLKMFQELK